jgi:hypothetical protein
MEMILILQISSRSVNHVPFSSLSDKKTFFLKVTGYAFLSVL